MTALPVSTVTQLLLLASAYGVSLKPAGQLGTCQYPFICQDNCEQGFQSTLCPDPSSDCPCIIKACWTLNDSCIHACNETALMVCLECVKGAPDNRCQVECSGVCLDAKCEHSQGECHRCVPGMYGQACSQDCSSVCGESCHRDTGYCKFCQHGRHGLECEHTCPNLCHTCSSEDGSCLRCTEGYTGENCNVTCADGFYGSDCVKKCSINCATTCDHISGVCVGGCKPGYYRSDCIKTCPAGRYGQDCASECAVTCAQSTVCDFINGSCTNGCSAGFQGQRCGILCSLGTYGANCNNNCSHNCFFGVCNRFSGHCQRCDVGRAGLFCEQVTHVRHSHADLDDEMSTDQTILIFLGLFALGGAMWSLLGTFYYYKQKIIIKKLKQTGQLPHNWTSLIRSYPQYFYNPKFLSKSKDAWGKSGRVDEVGNLHETEPIQAGHVYTKLGRKVTRQFPPRGLMNNVEIEGQRKGGQAERQRENAQLKWSRNFTDTKKVPMKGQERNVEMDGHRTNVRMEGQGKINTVASLAYSPVLEKDMGDEKTNGLAKSSRKISRGDSPENLTENMELERTLTSTARTGVYVVSRAQEQDKLATMFEKEEELMGERAFEETGKVIKDVVPAAKGGVAKSRTELHARAKSGTELHARAKSGSPPDSPLGGAGDTTTSTMFDITVSTTAGQETGLLAPRGAARSTSITHGEGMPHELTHKGIHLQQESQHKRKTQQERTAVVGASGTSVASPSCLVCGKQSRYSMECQCSTSAHRQQTLFTPVVLGRAKSNSLHENVGKENIPFLVEHVLSRTSSSYLNMKLAAAHSRHSRKASDVFKPRKPSIRTSQYRQDRVSRPRHTLASSVDAPRVEVSTAGETEVGSSETRSSTSGSSTLQTSKMKTTEASTEDDLSDSTSTTVVSSAITETSDEGDTSERSALSELQHRFFQAALERQSQPYLAKVDMWSRVDEQNPSSGVRNKDKYNKPEGFFQRRIRNMVGAFNKLIRGMAEPQEVVGTIAATVDTSKTFTQNEAVSSQLLIHRLESLRHDREAAIDAHMNLSERTHKRQRQASSMADKVSMAETLTEHSSVVSNTQRTSSRTHRGDSTITDASEVEYSTASSSTDVSASTTLRTGEASSTAASSSSGTFEESSDKPTSTDMDSLPAATKSHKSRHTGTNRSKYN